MCVRAVSVCICNTEEHRKSATEELFRCRSRCLLRTEKYSFRLCVGGGTRLQSTATARRAREETTCALLTATAHSALSRCNVVVTLQHLPPIALWCQTAACLLKMAHRRNQDVFSRTENSWPFHLFQPPWPPKPCVFTRNPCEDATFRDYLFPPGEHHA